MPRKVAIPVAFLSGFAVMVLEIAGMRLLARDFGGSFYVWTSQIGVVLVALTAGYVAGGSWADRCPGSGASRSAWLLVAAGLFTLFIPEFSAPLMDAIVGRHPADADIPRLWQKLDPALGAALVFLPPCFVLATLPPALIRFSARSVDEVGRASGWIYGAGSAGSIAGVFLTGYVLIDSLSLPQILRATGVLMLVLAGACVWGEGPSARPRPGQSPRRSVP